MHIKNPQHGFTLIEVVIAIGVTMVLGAIAAVSINRSVDMRDQLNQSLNQLNAVESFWQVLITDLNHASNRRLPSAAVRLGETRESAFMGGDPAASGSNYLLGANILFFARDGWPNPLQQQRSDLQRVAYRMDDDGRVWRDYWPERNQPLDDEPIGTRLIMENVEEIRVRFLPSNADKVVGGPWQDVWPPTDPDFQKGPWQLPAAVEITLTTTEFGDVQRIFALPGA
jgi:general secretion pathway protein J